MKNILVAGYPKCGNTWIGYLLAYYFNVPFYDTGIEETVLAGRLATDDIRYTYNHDGFLGEHERPDQKNRPRSIIKTHAPPSRLQDAHPKFLARQGYDTSDPHVLIVRDPKDVAVSLFYYRYFRMARVGNRWFARLPYSWRDRLFRRFYFDDLALKVAREWTDFCREWLKLDPLVIRYEDLLMDAVAEVRRVAQAFGLGFYPTYAEEAEEYCSFSNLRRREDRKFAPGADNERFFRSGKAGSWKQFFSPKLLAQSDWIMGELAEHFGYLSSPSSIS